MKKLLALSFFLLSSCTIYTEKQSEAVSQNVYAANDSLNKARVDLAYFYSNETIKFIKPPKHPININSVYQTPVSLKDAPVGDKTRIVMVPDQYKGDKVVVVDSSEYQELLKDKNINKQLTQDNVNKQKQLDVNIKEQIKQKEMTSKMINDLNYYQKEVYKLRLKCLWLSIIIAVIFAIIGGYFYLKSNTGFIL
jgi:hypothetical protein